MLQIQTLVIRFTSEVKEERPGYVVVLGSYKDLAEALRALRVARSGWGLPDTNLYLALNDYYATALETKLVVNVALAQAKKTVPNAYLYNARSFPVKLADR